MLCTVFLHFGPFSGGRGVKPNFADKGFMDTQTFLKKTRETPSEALSRTFRFLDTWTLRGHFGPEGPEILLKSEIRNCATYIVGHTCNH